MPSYFFEQITMDQALSYASTDALAFLTPDLKAAEIRIVFTAGTPTLAETVTLTARGQSVVFGSSFEGELDVLLPNGSVLYVGTTGANVDPRPGGPGDDAFYGNDGADRFTTGGGNNFAQGNQGNDTLIGGAGSDTMYGGKDNDSISTGDGLNFAQGNLGSDTVTGGIAADFLYGGQGNDQLVGGGGADYLNGNLGSDTVTGGIDNDLIFGEAGDDSLVGGGGMNTMSGGDGADQIVGGAGSDSISGGVGADTITGGAVTVGVPNGGRDFLSGGDGVDRFFFAAADSSLTAGSGDQILDWATEDRLAFAGNGAATALTYLEGTAGNYADAVLLANAAITAGVINYVSVQVGGDVVVFADVAATGNGLAEVAIVLVGRTLADIDFGNFVA